MGNMTSGMASGTQTGVKRENDIREARLKEQQLALQARAQADQAAHAERQDALAAENQRLSAEAQEAAQGRADRELALRERAQADGTALASRQLDAADRRYAFDEAFRTRQQDAAELGAERSWQMAIEAQNRQREQEAYKRQQDEFNRRRLIEQDMRQSMIDEQNMKMKQMQTWAFDEGILAKTLIDSWQDGKDANGNPTRNSTASQSMVNYMRQSGNPVYAGLTGAISAADSDGNPFMQLTYEDGTVRNIDPTSIFQALSVFDTPDGGSYVLGRWGGTDDAPRPKTTNDYLQHSVYRNRLSTIGQNRSLDDLSKQQISAYESDIKHKEAKIKYLDELMQKTVDENLKNRYTSAIETIQSEINGLRRKRNKLLGIDDTQNNENADNADNDETDNVSTYKVSSNNIKIGQKFRYKDKWYVKTANGYRELH